MAKHYSYPSIPQLRNFVTGLKLRAQYVGKDEDGNPKYDESIKLPVLQLNGTVKLHGTNGGISLDKDGEYYAMSREQILSAAVDNAGFFVFSQKVKNHFYPILEKIMVNYNFTNCDSIHSICIYGEWCGGSIKKGTALSNIDKTFVVFGIKVIVNPRHKGQEHHSIWLNNSLLSRFECEELGVYDIHSFPTYQMELDLNNPEASLDQLEKITLDIENECPVVKELISRGHGKNRNNSTIGEGVVWTASWQGELYRMKVKGEKHAVSRAERIVEIDPVKVENVNAFVEYSCTENRLQQGIDVMLENGISLERRNIGCYVKWVIEDIVKEEIDVLAKNELCLVDVKGPIGKKASEFILSKINSA